MERNFRNRNTQVATVYVSLLEKNVPAGCYYCDIRNVEVKKARSGNEFLQCSCVLTSKGTGAVYHAKINHFADSKEFETFDNDLGAAGYVDDEFKDIIGVREEIEVVYTEGYEFGQVTNRQIPINPNGYPQNSEPNSEELYASN